MKRHELDSEQWELIKPLLPPVAATGRPPKDRRVILNGILWLLRTGAPWRDLPDAYGPWATVWDLFDKWNGDGTLNEILRRLQAAQVDIGAIDEDLWCIDGTIVRAHRCAGGGGKKGIQTNRLITH